MEESLTNTPVPTRGSLQRYVGLKQMLTTRGTVLAHEVQVYEAGVRARVTARSHEAQGVGALADSDLQDEIRLAAVQLKAETLNKVNEALARLDAGRYGWCHGCGAEIAERRLRTTPFSIRCTACEQVWEIASRKTSARPHVPSDLPPRAEP